MSGKEHKPVNLGFHCDRARLEYIESRGGMNVFNYFLKVENLRADGEIVAERLIIPLTAEKYHALKEQYEDSTAEGKVFSLDGELEATVRSVCLN
jgi:hypothetical protein